MKITTKIVWDVDGNVLEHEWHEYSGPVAECKPGASATQKAGEQRSAADQAREDALTGTAQGTLSQFEGPVEQSPFYKALLTTGTEAVSDSYNNAASNVRARANQAGFGYNQPVENGAEAGVRTAQAKAQSQVPTTALTAASDAAMRAAGTTGNMGLAYGNQGKGYYDSAAQQDQRRQSMWNSLLQTGGQVAGMAAMGGF